MRYTVDSDRCDILSIQGYHEREISSYEKFLKLIKHNTFIYHNRYKCCIKKIYWSQRSAFMDVEYLDTKGRTRTRTFNSTEVDKLLKENGIVSC